MDLKSRIKELEDSLAAKQITPGFALARLALDFTAGNIDGYGRLIPDAETSKAAGPARVARVSFRKNVEVAPYKHEHAEVTVDVNDGTFPEAVEMAKKLVDEALGVDVSREEYERALLTLERAKRAGFKASR